MGSASTIDIDSILTTIRDRIVSRFQPLRLIVFGSVARGEAGRDSDVDLLVVVERTDDKRALAVEIASELSDLPIGKDVIVTTLEEIARRGDEIGSVLRPALREGRVLFERA
jgi:uncharacterized protein